MAESRRTAREAQQQRPSGRRHLNTPELGPIQQPNPQLFLEQLNMLAHRGLAEVQLFGSAAKARLLGNRAKDLDPVVLQHERGVSNSISLRGC